MNEPLVVIPAIKKNAVIPDQLIKKLNGITLIQRAINTTKELVTSSNILIVTDSEEISLISQRNNIPFYKDKTLRLDSSNILRAVEKLVSDKVQSNIFLFRANTPLIDVSILRSAYKEFLQDTAFILTSTKLKNGNWYEYQDEKLSLINHRCFEELKSFHIFSKKHAYKRQFKPFVIEQDRSIEIGSYQDWWVCEKILQRKRIIFNVIGDTKVGMGHIYHSLALAHEITDHEILFVCDRKYKIALEKIASMDYEIISTNNTLKTIIELQPDLVINDILNTEKEYILRLKNKNIKVVNFEDLGEGSQYADMVFNELYDIPQIEGKNYFWGYKYLALRDEFTNAKAHININEVKEILILFGGTDQNNLTLGALKAVLKTCEKNKIVINIVCGGGYQFGDKLEVFLQETKYNNINLFYSSEVISSIMERTQLAISSNGRTVYELADMNIPSIIISHHAREVTHTFATLEKGFINLGVYHDDIFKNITDKFNKLVDDVEYRKLLFLNIKKYSFRKNKEKVVKKILELL